MTFGKTIELFWVDGTAQGLVTAELSNWSGKGFKIPRTELRRRDDLTGAGVYFLLSQQPDGREAIYIGEAENVYERLYRHISDYRQEKEPFYWSTALAFLGRDLDKTTVRYLENRLFSLAQACGVCLLTKNTYKRTVIKESKAAEMEEFLQNLLDLLEAMGYSFLTPPPAPGETTQLLFCRSKSAEGRGFLSPGGLTVLAGSRVSDHLADSFLPRARSYYELRQKLEEDGTIQNRLFTKNHEFPAPSAASSVLLGRLSNGKNDWKTEDGKKLGTL